MSSHPSSRTGSLTAGRVVVVVLVILLVLFAVLNSQSVQMHWIVATSSTPLFVMLLLFAAIGFVVGWFVGRRPRGR